MKLLFSVLGFFALSAALAQSAEARDSRATLQAKQLLARLQAKKPESISIREAPILKFTTSPRIPIQNQALTVYVQSDNLFTNRDLSIDAKLNGTATSNIQSPTKGLFVVSLGLQTEVRNSSLEATLYLEDPQTHTDVRNAVKALDVEVRRLTTQINNERDPAKRQILQQQRDEKLALKNELLAQLKKFRVKVGTKAFAFAVQPANGLPSLPTVSSISPVVGSVNGGTAVTISGANFTSNVAVKFGGIAATSVTFVNSSTITAVTPGFSGVVGAKDLELRFTTSQGLYNVISPAAFFAVEFMPSQPVKPVAVASGSGRFTFGTPVNLDGTLSYGREGGLTYAWTVSSVPPGTYPPGYSFGGNAAISITPPARGTYVFQLVVTENDTPEHLVSDPSIVVLQIDGAPQPIANPIVVAQNGTGTTHVLANDSTIGDTATFSITPAPTHGAASVDQFTGIVTYSPFTDYVGSDSLIVRATDQTGQFGTVSIPISVITSAQAPLLAADPISTHTEPGQSQVTVTNATGGQTFTYSILLQPQHGTATIGSDGIAHYSSNSGFTGNDAFIVRAVNNANNLRGELGISVAVNSNTTPVVSAANIQIAMNTSGTTQASVTDDSGQTGTYSVTQPAHGTASINSSGLASYTPTSDYSGNDSFEIRYTDNGSPNVTGTKTVSVVVNGAPEVVENPSISIVSGGSGTSHISSLKQTAIACLGRL